MEVNILGIAIGDIAESTLQVTRNTKNTFIDEHFRADPDCQGIVVVEDDRPIALVTRTFFYQKLGSLYGYNLFINRSSSLLMKTDILCFSYETSIIEASEQAMERMNADLYDYIIITKDDKYFGIVTIRSLLMKFAQIQSTIASSKNPLTQLPGNPLIEEHLNKLLSEEKYSVLYIDLDQFKAYNDLYGFAKGDQVILQTAEILKENTTNGFIGHIGGDDFIIVLPDWNFESLAEMIIEQFNLLIANVYKNDHLKNGYVITKNRTGIPEKTPLVSISIAVVNNKNRAFSSVEEIVDYATKIKKECKSIKTSCYLTNDLVKCL